MLARRGRAKAPKRRTVCAHVATGSNQAWSWDITYLMTPVRGIFPYLYLMMDLFSRKAFGVVVHDSESADLAAALFRGDVSGAWPRAAVRARGTVPHIRRRREGPLLGVVHRRPRRWVLERTASWRNRFCGLLVRSERGEDNYLAVVQLVCGLIAFHQARGSQDVS